MWIIGTCVVILTVALLINRKAVGTFFGVCRAWLGKTSRDIQAKNAMNLLQQAVDDHREKLKTNTKQLKDFKATLNSLERRVQNNLTDEGLLSAKIKKAIEEGLKDDDPVLKTLAKRLHNVREEKKRNESDLIKIGTSFQALMTFSLI